MKTRFIGFPCYCGNDLYDAIKKLGYSSRDITRIHIKPLVDIEKRHITFDHHEFFLRSERHDVILSESFNSGLSGYDDWLLNSFGQGLQ